MFDCIFVRTFGHSAKLFGPEIAANHKLSMIASASHSNSNLMQIQ